MATQVARSLKNRINMTSYAKDESLPEHQEAKLDLQQNEQKRCLPPEIPISRHSSLTQHRRERFKSTQSEGPRGRRRYERSSSSSLRGRSRSPCSRERRDVSSSSKDYSSSRNKRQRHRSCSNSRERNTSIKSHFYRRLLRVHRKEIPLSDRFRKDEVLKQDNWMIWKTCIMRTLADHRLEGFPLGDYHAPDKAKDDIEYQAWLRLDRAVSDYILKNISRKQLLSIPAFLHINGSHNNEMTSTEVWQHLREVYETYDIAQLFRTLFTIAEEGADIKSHLERMIEIRTKLANANHHFEDYVFNGIILGTLPESWREFVDVHYGIMAGMAFQNKGKDTESSTILLTNAIRAEWHRIGDTTKYVNKSSKLRNGICRFNRRGRR